MCKLNLMPVLHIFPGVYGQVSLKRKRQVVCSESHPSWKTHESRTYAKLSLPLVKVA